MAQGRNLSSLDNALLQAEVYAINACILVNSDRGYRNRHTYILPNSQVAIKALDNYKINSKLANLVDMGAWSLG
jgi:hypothetical protein